MKSKLKIFLAIEYLTGILFLIYLFFVYNNSVTSLKQIIFFTIMLFISHNITLFLNSLSEVAVSINLPILVSVIILLDPFWAALVAFLGSIEIQYRDHKIIWYKVLFNMFMFIIAVGISAVVFEYFYEYAGINLYICVLISVLVYSLLNNILLYIVINISSEEDNVITHISFIKEMIKNIIVSYFLGMGLYFVYIEAGPLMFLTGIILIYIIKDFLYSHFKQLNSFTQVIESFIKVIDSKDHYTEGHCKRVAKYALVLCEELGVKRSRREKIVNMAKIHDIGKINVDDEILKKPDRLTEKEFKEMKKHSKYGYEILKEIDLFEDSLKVIFHHHEQYDGSGYPEGISGEEIPLGARILNVCDAFDVMTTGRTYKQALDKPAVIEELKQYSGRQFDPQIAEKMINLIKKGRFDGAFRSTIREKQTQLRAKLKTE